MTSAVGVLIESGWPGWVVAALSLIGLLAVMPLGLLQARAPLPVGAWLAAPFGIAAVGVIGTRHGMGVVERVQTLAPLDQLYRLTLNGESVAVLPGVLAAGGLTVVAAASLAAVALTSRRHLIGTRLMGVIAGALTIVVAAVLFALTPSAGQHVYGLYKWAPAAALAGFGVAATLTGRGLSDRRERAPTEPIGIVIAALGILLVSGAGTCAVLLDGHRALHTVALVPDEQQPMIVSLQAAAAFAAAAARAITTGVAGVLAVVLVVVSRQGARASSTGGLAALTALLVIMGGATWLERSLEQDFESMWRRLPTPPADLLSRSTSREPLSDVPHVFWSSDHARDEMLALVRSRATPPAPTTDPDPTQQRALSLSVEADVSASAVAEALRAVCDKGATHVALLAVPDDAVLPDNALQLRLHALGARPLPPPLTAVTVGCSPPRTPPVAGLLVDRGRVTVLGSRPFEARPQATGPAWAELAHHLTLIKRAWPREHRIVLAATSAATFDDVMMALDAARESADGHALFPAATWLPEAELAGAVDEAPVRAGPPAAADKDDDPLVP
jgi:hypothetical protein